jgi:hypothetical protein
MAPPLPIGGKARGGPFPGPTATARRRHSPASRDGGVAPGTTHVQRAGYRTSSPRHDCFWRYGRQGANRSFIRVGALGRLVVPGRQPIDLAGHRHRRGLHRPLRRRRPRLRQLQRRHPVDLLLIIQIIGLRGFSPVDARSGCGLARETVGSCWLSVEALSEGAGALLVTVNVGWSLSWSGMDGLVVGWGQGGAVAQEDRADRLGSAVGWWRRCSWVMVVPTRGGAGVAGVAVTRSAREGASSRRGTPSGGRSSAGFTPAELAGRSRRHDHVLPPTRLSAVLAGVKAKPPGWPAAGLDPGYRRHPSNRCRKRPKEQSYAQDPPT